MPKGSEELTNARKTEIIEACKQLYESMSFKDITIKKIGNVTSFTRTSIYNYFQTKEEIFLAILQDEYGKWNASLADIFESVEKIERVQFAEMLANMLSERSLLLKIISMNMYDIEENSRIERLVEFKKSFGRCLFLVEGCLKKITPEMTAEERTTFIYSFFPFVYGIYPYTTVTKKQREAMELVGIEYKHYSVHDITFNAVKKLLETN